MDIDCLSCGFMNALYEQKEGFSIALYRFLAEIMFYLLIFSVPIYVLAKLIMGMIQDNLVDELKSLIKPLIIISVFITTFLTYGVTINRSATPLSHGWIIQPAEQLAGNIAVEIVILANTFNSDPSGVNRLQDLEDMVNSPGHPKRKNVEVTINGKKIVNYYSVLAYGVERSMYYIIKLGWALFGLNVGETIIGLLLVLPYLFVVLIFAAFMVEAMFSFLAMSMFMPTALYCAAFPSLRSIFTATLRVLAGAYLTIFFAAGAMGFSVAVVDTLGNQYVRTQEAKDLMSSNINVLATEYRKVCHKEEWGGNVARQNPYYNPERCQEVTKELAAAEAQMKEFIKASKDNDAWLVLILMGGVSILLHLKSKTIASNLSGAQDGAGPAAAVVAGSKALIFAGMMAGNKSLTGQGGLGGQMFGDGGATGGMTGNLRGALQAGGLAGGLRHILGGNMGGGGDAYGRQSPMDMAREAAQGTASPFSTGGGSASQGQVQTMQIEQTQLQSLIEALSKNSSGTASQDREGNDI